MKTGSRVGYIAAVGILMLAGSIVASAEQGVPTDSQQAAYVENLIENAGSDKSILDALNERLFPPGLPPYLQEKNKAMLRSFFADKKFRQDYAAAIIRESQHKEGGQQTDFSFNRLFSLGLRRMDEPTVITGVRFYQSTLATMTPGECAAWFRHDPVIRMETTAFQLRALQTMSRKEIDSYFSMMKRAVLAEVHQRPAVKVVKPEDEQAANAALLKRLEQRMPPEEWQRLKETVKDQANALDADVCNVGKAMLAATLELPPAQRQALIFSAMSER